MRLRRIPAGWRPLLVVLAAFVVLAAGYAWATPPFEASDELWHFGMIQRLAEFGDLPVQTPGTDTPWEQEGSQPPLYYALAAALVRPIDRSDFDAVRQPNPHAIAGIPGAVGNKNLILRDTPQPPLRGTILAVYLVRALSIGLGMITVSAVFASARQLAPGCPRVALLAAALTAFNPMFLFISASANNDNLVTAFNSLIIWQMLRMLDSGFSLRRSVGVALLVALASLSKLSGLALLPALGLAAMWTAYRRRDGRGLLVFGGLLAGLWLLLAGWWFARNLILYDELFGTRMMAQVAGARAGGFTLAMLLDEFQGFRFAYWALFGAVNIMTFRWFYDVMDGVTLVALAGLAIYLWYARRNREIVARAGILAIIVLTGAGAVIAWTAQTFASQGRLLFPYMAASSPLLALGLTEAMRVLSGLVSRISGRPAAYASLRRLPGAMAGTLAMFALVVPPATIAPQYAPPAPLQRLPEAAQGVYARFDDAVELVGYTLPAKRMAPGERLPVTVYWRALAHTEQDLSLYLHAVLDDGSVIGKVDSYPGGGRLRTTTWLPGAIYADAYALELSELADGISRLRLEVGWWDYATGERLSAFDEAGRAISPVMLNAGGFAPPDVQQSGAALTAVEGAVFSDKLALAGYRLESDRLTLLWAVLRPPEADYTVFAQVLDAQGQIVGQGDAPPALPTRFWRAGERFLTEHTLVYPRPPAPGIYRLVVGWYRPDDWARLDADAPDDAFPLATFSRP